MRKVTFGVASSLDNFIARPDNGVDWLLWCEEARIVSEAAWRGVDTLLMGRKTYEVALASSHGGEGGPSEIETYVFSRTLAPDPVRDRGAKIVSDDVADFVRGLKQEPGRDIIVLGGGALARPLFEAGLIDELGLNVHPVLLGAGAPLFPGLRRQVDLELQRCEPFPNGCVYLHYRVRSSTGDAARSS